MHAGLISFRIGVTWFGYAAVRIARRVLFSVVGCYAQLSLCPLITSTHIHTFVPHRLIYLTISCLSQMECMFRLNYIVMQNVCLKVCIYSLKITFSLNLCRFPMFHSLPTRYVVILPYNFIIPNRLLTLLCIFMVVNAGGCDCLGRKQIRYMFVGHPFRSARKEDVRVNLWDYVVIM